jgi:hypothetical protein
MRTTRSTLHLLALGASLLLAACASGLVGDDEPVVVARAAPTRAHRIINDSLQIVAESPARDRIVYVTHCDEGVGTALRAFDLRTRAGRLLALGRFECTPAPMPPVPGAPQQPWQMLRPGSATFSPTGEHVAFVAADGAMSVYSFTTRTKARFGEQIGLHAFSPDGTRLAFAQPDALGAIPGAGALYVLDLRDGTWQILATAGGVLAPFADGGRRLLFLTDVGAATGGTLRAWDFATRTAVTIAAGVVLPVTVSGDGSTVVFLGEVGELPAPDPTQPQPPPPSGTLFTYHLPSGARQAVETTTGLAATLLSDDGQTLAYVTGLDFTTYKATLKLAHAGAAPVVVDADLAPMLAGGASVALSAAGDFVAFARFPGALDPFAGTPLQPDVAVHEVATGTTTVLSAAVPSQFVQLRFSPQGGLLLYGWQAMFPFPVATLAVWDARTRVSTPVEGSANPAHVTFLPGDAGMVFIGSETLDGGIGDLKTWDAATRVVTTLAPAVYQYTPGPDGRTLVFQAARTPGDPMDPTVVLGRVTLGAAVPTAVLVDPIGPAFLSVLVGADRLAYVKPDGLYVATLP